MYLAIPTAGTWNLDYRDHMFDTELLGHKKQTHNIEFATGLTVFF